LQAATWNSAKFVREKAVVPNYRAVLWCEIMSYVSLITFAIWIYL